MKIIFSAFILFFFGVTYAQPGGGGGILITDFRVDGKSIASNDAELIINQYQLSKNLKNIKQKLSDETHSSWWSGVIDVKTNTFLLIPPFQRTKKTTRNYLTNQRLELIYKKDTMCIDFVDVLPFSPGGSSDKIDELNFVKGHFVFYRNPKKDFPLIWKSLTEGIQYAVTENRMKIITRENIRFLDDLGLVKIVNMPLKIATDLENNIDYPILERNRISASSSFYSIDKKGTFTITTDQEPLLINGAPQYNFRYYWINDEGNGREKAGYPAEKILLQDFKQRLLNKTSLSINKKPYSGVLKIVFLSEILSQPIDPLNPFITTTIITRFKLYYKNGVQTKQEVY